MEDDPVKKRVVMPVILLYTFLLLGLTACGDKLPDLSEDQSELVAEYAAGVALENSENYDSGIASAEEIEKEEKRIERIEKREQAATEATDTTNQETGETNNTTNTEAPVLESVDLVSFLELKDVEIQFLDFAFYKSYPDDSNGGDYISITSREDSTLLVCRFQVTNLSAQEQEINLLDKKALFRVLVNQEKELSALPTLLPDDMTTLKDVIAGNATIEVVTVSEVKQDEIGEVETLALNVKYNGNTGSVLLK